jgi:hypothetical protein
MLRQGQKATYGGTPQGAYGQQGQYMQDAMNPVTSQQQMLMNQGGPEFMSFNTPFAG